MSAMLQLLASATYKMDRNNAPTKGVITALKNYLVSHEWIQRTSIVRWPQFIVA
jgi:hypothetical protein